MSIMFMVVWDALLLTCSLDNGLATVNRRTHRSGAVIQIWFLTEHDLPRRIKYVMFLDGMEIMEFETRLEIASASETKVTMEHRIASLAEEINEKDQRFADGNEGFLERQRMSMAAALKNGKR